MGVHGVYLFLLYHHVLFRLGGCLCQQKNVRHICGFDEGIEGFAYNNLVKINDDDIWEMMEKDEHVD